MKTLIILLLFSVSITAQTKKLYKVYVFGMHGVTIDSCTTKVNDKYGIRPINVGCVLSRRKVNHNDRIDEKLYKRNGLDWKEKYKAEIAQCK